MASIVELAAALEEAAVIARDVRSQDALKSRLEAVSKEFRQVADDLDPVVRFMEECVQAEIVTEFPPDVSQRLEELSQAKNNFLESPEKYTDSSELRELITRLTQLNLSWRNDATSAWNDFCQRHVPSRQEGVVRALETSGDNDELLVELKKIDNSLSYLIRQAPIDQTGGPSELVKLIKERTELWDKLSDGDIPTDVARFLNLASATGAPVNAVTPTVLDWLRERDLDDGFVVKSRDDDD